jgi:PEP-CTERM motif
MWVRWVARIYVLEGILPILSRKLLRGFAPAALAIGLSAALGTCAHSEEFRFTLSGVFNGTPTITDSLTAGAGPNLLTENDPFTLTATFDSSAVAFGIPFFFNAYVPQSVTLSVGGTDYSVATISQNAVQGFTVAIFETGFMGHVGAGFLANPFDDGAGIIADFLTSSPSFALPNLVSASYTAANYFGVGFGSGPCPSPPPDGSGACVPAGDKNTTVPIPLDGGVSELTLGEYSLTNPIYSGVPGIPPSTFNPNLFTATLTAVPEPSTWALLLVGFAGLAAAGSLARRKADLAV